MSETAANSSGGKKESNKKKAYFDVDVNNVNRGVWLVKVPKYISDRWQNPDLVQPKQSVGKLKIVRSAAASKPMVTFSLEDKVTVELGDKSVAIPKEHKFMVSGLAAQSMAVFSHTRPDPDDPSTENPVSADGSFIHMEGKVVQRAECRPISNDVYMKVKKESIMLPILSRRKTQHTQLVNSYKPIARHPNQLKAEKEKKEMGKRSRDDKSKVMDTLFALFEKHQYYNIKDLIKETRQPVGYLKEILGEVCVYRSKNPHKFMWELKPEFRHYKEKKTEEDKPGDGSESSDDD